MLIQPVTYPATPQHVDEAILKPTPAFKKEVTRVLSSLLLFLVFYILLTLAAGALAVACCIGGVLLIAAYPHFITLMIGVGLIGLGLMVLFFVFKFIFKRNKVDRAHLVEVKQEDQPELFAFIKKLTQETQTPFPKHIYISADVNACVFYDSSFWSMLLPIRKNLQIGLGLVNSVNLSEFKAILAHEFGHFSQRSMKLGSYVYNMNHIIYNLLYDNDGYSETLTKWGNISGYFAFFAMLTAKIVVGIQWILQKIYSVINKSYLALSRQMEFHADTVAAAVSGSEPLINSLRRLEVADNSYQRLFQFYNQKFKEGLKPDNLYPQHTAVMHQLAHQQNIPLEHGLPQVTALTFSKYNTTRVLVKDQWASHPSTDDRESHLRNLNINSETITLSAWSIFRNPEQLQKRMTDQVYANVTFEKTPSTLNTHSFQEAFEHENEKYLLPKVYKDFFDFRYISTLELKGIEIRVPHARSLEAILTDDTLRLPLLLNGVKTDISLLEAIENKTYQIQWFEFEGRKHKPREASSILSILRQQLTEVENKLIQADEQVVAYFIQSAKNTDQHELLREQYFHLQETARQTENDVTLYTTMMNEMQPLYHEVMEFPRIRQIIAKINMHEVTMKQRLQELLKNPVSAPLLTADEKDILNKYLGKNQIYFIEPEFQNEALHLLNEAIQFFYYLSVETNFITKKNLLTSQLNYLKS